MVTQREVTVGPTGDYPGSAAGLQRAITDGATRIILQPGVIIGFAHLDLPRRV